MYTYRIGPDPDGGRSRGTTGAEKGQAFLQGISRANGWTDVEEKADEFFEYLTSKEECHNNISLLVQKALENIREYYDQESRWKKLQKNCM